MHIRIHGHGRQGISLAGHLLASAAIESGWHAVAYPATDFSSHGAQIVSLVDIEQDAVPDIEAGAPADVDCVIVQDFDLLLQPATLAGLRSNGCVLSDIAAGRSVDLPGAFHLATVPVREIAAGMTGSPAPAVGMLAAFCQLTGLFPLAALESVLARRAHADTASRDLIRTVAGMVEADAWSEPVRHCLANGRPCDCCD